MKGRLNAVEICLVEGLDYATAPGSGESCCKLILKFIDPSSNVCGKSFRFTLPELNFSDFLVEKTWYDAAVSRSWTSGEICLVWWRNENGEGGNWWEGRIMSSKPKSGDFPDSPWERYVVQYKSDPEPQSHSPWELHDPESRWEPPHIDFERRNKLLDSLAKLERRKQVLKPLPFPFFFCLVLLCLFLLDLQMGICSDQNLILNFPGSSFGRTNLVLCF